MENEVDLNTNKITLHFGGMEFKFSDLMEKLNEAGLLPHPERTEDNKVKCITRYKGQFKLCFIRGNFAYFTPKPLHGENRQWGDDWDDAPFQHNAGLPYDMGKIVKIAFDFPNLSEGYDYFLPHHYPRKINNVEMPGKLCVEDINERKVCPWIDFYDGEVLDLPNAIWAGDSINEFIEKIHNNGGEIYTKS